MAFDPTARFVGHGTFVLTGEVSSQAGVKSVEITAELDAHPKDIAPTA